MNEIQILYGTHQHHVLSTQSGLRYLKIAKKGYEGERDSHGFERVEITRGGSLCWAPRSDPGGLALGTAWSVQLPPPWPNWRQPQPCNCLQLCCGPEHTYSHRWASLRTGVATQCPSYMWEKAIAACNCRPAPISLSQRSPI